MFTRVLFKIYNVHTSDSVRNQDEDAGDGIHPLQLFEEREVEQRVRLAIREQQLFGLRSRLLVNFLDQREFLGSDQAVSLVSLQSPPYSMSVLLISDPN
jgi:hypothetical protein